MHHCFICRNKTDQIDVYDLLCNGCKSLVCQPEFFCRQCGVKLSTSQTRCGQCLVKPPKFSETRYAAIYQYPIDQWVMSYKFSNNIKLSRLFAELIHQQLTSIPRYYVLMPVPLHGLRLKKRGYNQAYEMAVELSKLSGRQLDTSLKRHKKTAMQAQLTLSERNKNVRSAFSLRKTLKNCHVILIDDVMTTGNTLNECAKTLHKGGAKDIRVAVFARKFLS